MGREVQCLCKIGSAQAPSKVLLEATEVIIRGELRRKIPLLSITDLRVSGTQLVFRTGKERVELDLGEEPAQKWLAAMQKPPATLAQKLGIKAETRVQFLGDIDCSELSDAVAVGQRVQNGSSDLIIARVDCVSSLQSAIQGSLCGMRSGAALWLVYPKGTSGEIGETIVREAARKAGLRDTKVASVSPRLTGLRFSIAQ